MASLGGPTDPPATVEITSEMRASCVMAGAREPDEADVVLALASARAKGHRRLDWGAYVVEWMVRGKKFAAIRTPHDVAADAELVAAYERGIATGKGGPYAMQADAAPTLVQAVATFGRKRSGEALTGANRLGWTEDAAKDFAQWVMSSTEPRAVSLYSSFAPKGFLRWLNEQYAAREARRAP